MSGTKNREHKYRLGRKNHSQASTEGGGIGEGRDLMEWGKAKF